MRLHVHDFSGHPFQVQLSRKLAELGNEVEHSYCDQYVCGKGAMLVQPDDPPELSIVPVSGPITFKKYNPVARAIFEFAYAVVLWRRISRSRADAVVLCNAPLLTTYLVKTLLCATRTPWIFWHQDIYSSAMRDEVHQRFPLPLARMLGTAFARMERACVRDAGAVVAIDGVFCGQYRSWGLEVDHVTVVPNWAPIDAIRPGARDNDWSREREIPRDRLRLLYSGTLGRKHNPLLLIRLLRLLEDAGVRAHLTVVSEGVGAELLRSSAGPGDELTVLPFQPMDRLSEVLSSADALVALLEPEASTFSIPSKVLSYLAAGRPIVGLMPRNNAAANAIHAVGSVTADPDDDGLQQVAGWLSSLTSGSTAWEKLGVRSRKHAEREFDIDVIGPRFEHLLRGLGVHGSRDGAASGRGVGRTAVGRVAAHGRLPAHRTRPEDSTTR